MRLADEVPHLMMCDFKWLRGLKKIKNFKKHLLQLTAECDFKNNIQQYYAE